MKIIHSDIVACYLYIITKHGYPPESKDALKHLKEFKELGFKSIELEGIREKHLMEIYSMRHEIHAYANELGLEIPIFCIVLPGLSSPDPVEREKNLALFQKGCEIADVFGSQSVLDNSPLPPWQFPSGIPVTRHYDEEVLAAASIPSGLKWNIYWNELVMTYRKACEIAKSYNLNYHMHPCFGALVNSTDSYLLFAESVKMDNLKFNLDTANQFFMKDNLYLSLIRLANHIDYIHISDNRGFKMEHLGYGKGEIEWDKFLETLDRINYKGKFGMDIGGAESAIDDLDKEYHNTSLWLEDKWFKNK